MHPESSLALIGNASGRRVSVSRGVARGIFDKETRRKPLAVAADALVMGIECSFGTNERACGMPTRCKEFQEVIDELGEGKCEGATATCRKGGSVLIKLAPVACEMRTPVFLLLGCSYGHGFGAIPNISEKVRP